MNKYLTIFLLLLIFTFGFFLRFYRLEEVPAGFMQDEAVAGYDAYSLIKTGKDHHGVSWPVTFQAFNDWTGHSFSYQLIPFVNIFGLNAFSVRLAVAFYSTLTIALIYFLGKELTGDNTIAFVATFLFSLSQFSVVSSRWAVQPNTVSFFITLSLLLFFTGVNRLRLRRIIWVFSGILFGASLYSYPSVEGFIPIWLAGISLFLLFINRKQKLRKLIVDLIFLIVSFSIVALPLLTDHIFRPETITIKLSMISVEALTDNPVSTFIKNYLSFYLPWHQFLQGDINPVRAVPGFGYENIIIGIFYYIGITLLVFQKKSICTQFPVLSKEKIYCIYWFLLAFPLIPSLTLPEGNFQRAIYILPVMILLASIGIVYSYKSIRKLISPSSREMFFIVIVFIFSFYLYQQYNFYSYYFGPQYRAYTQWYFQYGMENVIKFTSANENKYNSILIDNTINMPYIYVLFYKKIDPLTLTYEDFTEVNQQTKWLSVKRFEKYVFRKITKDDIEHARLLKIIYNSPFSQYAVYRKNDELIVKFEVISKPNILLSS